MFFLRNMVARQVGPNSQGANVSFAKYGGPSSGSLLSVGGIIIFLVMRHLLAAAVDPDDTLHVQYTSDGIRSLTTLTSSRSVACMRPWAWCVPTVSLSRTVIFRLLSVVDHVDHT